MVAALPQNRQRIHRTVLPNQRFAILYGQNVVGRLNHLSIAAQRFQRLLAGGCIGDSRLQFLPQPLFQPVREQQLRRLPESLRRFAAEGKSIADAKSGQNRHTAGSKALCRLQRRRHRQFQHKISTGQHGSFCPNLFGIERRFSPLDKIAAHQADNGRILPADFPYSMKLFPVSQMEGIVLADNADCLHGIPR